MATNKKSKGTSKKSPQKKGKSTKVKVLPPAPPQETPASSDALVALGDIDVARFESAYERLLAKARAIPAGALQGFNVDLLQAALVALKVAQASNEPSLRQRFANLAKSGEYSDAPVELLADVAMATWYARYRAIHADRTMGVTPRELASEGYTLRSKMLRVLEYNLGDKDAVMHQIALIRAGTGYLDLATDLTALADLYDKQAEALALDKRHYRPEDRDNARRLASRILTYLGNGPSVPPEGWGEIQTRFWTLLDQTYREVRRGGLFLFSGEDGERRFPSLQKATRDRFPAPPRAKPTPESTP